MPTKYIPRPDADFAAFAAHYFQAVVKWWERNGLDQSDLKPLETAVSVWQKEYPAHVAAQARAEAARQSKDAARANLEREIRPVTNFIQTYPKTTDADRATIGITVRQPGASLSPPPTGRPLARVDTSERLRHTIRFSDEATPTRKARPRGTLGAEVRVKLVDPGQPAPSDPEALSFVTVATNGVVTTDYPSTAGGKTAVYMLRWMGPRGQVGPWSEAVNATVAA